MRHGIRPRARYPNLPRNYLRWNATLTDFLFSSPLRVAVDGGGIVARQIVKPLGLRPSRRSRQRTAGNSVVLAASFSIDLVSRNRTRKEPARSGILRTASPLPEVPPVLIAASQGWGFDPRGRLPAEKQDVVESPAREIAVMWVR